MTRWTSDKFEEQYGVSETKVKQDEVHTGKKSTKYSTKKIEKSRSPKVVQDPREQTNIMLGDILNAVPLYFTFGEEDYTSLAVTSKMTRQALAHVPLVLSQVRKGWIRSEVHPPPPYVDILKPHIVELTTAQKRHDEAYAFDLIEKHVSSLQSLDMAVGWKELAEFDMQRFHECLGKACNLQNLTLDWELSQSTDVLNLTDVPTLKTFIGSGANRRTHFLQVKLTPVVDTSLETLELENVELVNKDLSSLNKLESLAVNYSNIVDWILPQGLRELILGDIPVRFIGTLECPDSMKKLTLMDVLDTDAEHRLIPIPSSVREFVTQPFLCDVKLGKLQKLAVFGKPTSFGGSRGGHWIRYDEDIIHENIPVDAVENFFPLNVQWPSTLREIRLTGGIHFRWATFSVPQNVEKCRVTIRLNRFIEKVVSYGRSLQILHLVNLEVLRKIEFHGVSHLQKLNLVNCRLLTDFEVPDSVTELSLVKCPLLKRVRITRDVTKLVLKDLYQLMNLPVDDCSKLQNVRIVGVPLLKTRLSLPGFIKFLARLSSNEKGKRQMAFNFDRED